LTGYTNHSFSERIATIDSKVTSTDKILAAESKGNPLAGKWGGGVGFVGGVWGGGGKEKGLSFFATLLEKSS